VISLDPALVAAAVARLADADAARARRYPGDPGTRQPVHTCYVPANRLAADTPRRWGAEALALLDTHEWAVSPRVIEKLRREPIEDLRIDFEDGYGVPEDSVEDADAVRAARYAVAWDPAPPWFGLRVKSFDTPRLRDRSIRTLDVFLTALLGAAGGLPDGFVVTFPKVTDVVQVEVFAEILALLEARLGLADGAVRFEIQVETAQAIIDGTGRLALPGWITAGAGRVTGFHFGTYDYTAACGLGAADQHLAHDACDFARHVMQVAAAETGVRISDGSTNVLPVGDAVLHGWRTHYDLVRRSLSHGFYQGWDLHPGQLVTRYAAVYDYFRAGAVADAARLKAYVEGSGGAVADEPATAQALSRSFLRALECGVLTAEEITELTDLPVASLSALARREPVRPSTLE